MSELIQMRYRMKAVKTIQKVTRAMCLVSMAKHTRLRTQKTFLENYYNTLRDLFTTLKIYSPSWHHAIFNPKTTDQKTLVIIIGSQKGLCGNFNSSLLHFVAREIKQLHQPVDIITIGQHAAYNYHSFGTHLKEFNIHSTLHMASIAQECVNYIINSSKPYTHVVVFSNQAKKFFIQKPHSEILLPFTEPPLAKKSHEDFIWEQSPREILDALALQLIQTHLFRLMFDSLLAEQAARFIAMDGATRNANTLLTAMRLSYNKIRQAKITRELTDLVGSFF